MDMHEILKMALKELEATASAADVAAYIQACADKQAAIDGAAAAEEKKAEKDAAKDDKAAAAVPPEEVVPPEEIVDPAAMSQVAPAGVVTPPGGDTQGANGPGASLDAQTPEQAGMAQLEALLTAQGASLATLIAAIQAKPDALKALLSDTPASGGQADGIPVSDAQMEGNRPLSAKPSETIALKAQVDAAQDTIRTLSARVTEYETKEKAHAEEVKAAEARGVAQAEAAKKLALGERVKGLITSARLVPARGRTVEQTIETWTSLGMTAPEAFEGLVADLPEGVPLSAITAKDGPAFRTSAAGDDGDKDSEDGDTFRLCVKQWEPIVGRKAAEAKARESVARLRTGGKTTTDKLTGTA